MPDINMYGDIQNESPQNKAVLKHVGLVKRVALHLRARIPKLYGIRRANPSRHSRLNRSY